MGHWTFYTSPLETWREDLPHRRLAMWTLPLRVGLREWTTNDVILKFIARRFRILFFYFVQISCSPLCAENPPFEVVVKARHP